MLTLGGKSVAHENLFRIAIHMKQFRRKEFDLRLSLFLLQPDLEFAVRFARNQFHQIDFRPNTPLNVWIGCYFSYFAMNTSAHYDRDALLSLL